MKVVVAPDKFKGCLSAAEVAEAMARGVLAAVPSAEVDRVPMADGGEGTVDALVAATGGRFLEATVTSPLGESVQARFGMLGDGRTAVIEMAAASGLVLVPASRRNPLTTTTRGTGELLLTAIEAGARRVILGIGGSATNDGGAGLAQALGYRLLDRGGNELGPGGGALGGLARINAEKRDRRIDEIELLVACDVDNPLCGPTGASAVYGPQKGATQDMITRLDANLAHYAEIIERDLGVAIRDLPGAGAAGGLGGGLVAFARGTLKRGIELVIAAVGLAGRMQGASLCLTGEGALDASSAFGKTAVGVARVARECGCPTVALAGSIGPGAEAVHEQGITASFSICPGPATLEQSMAQAAQWIERSANQVIRLWLGCSRDVS